MPARLTRRTRSVALVASGALVLATAALAASGSAVGVVPAAHHIAKPTISAATVKLDSQVTNPLTSLVQLLKQPSGYSFKANMTDLKVGGLFETVAGYGVERDSAGVWHYITGFNNAGHLMLGAVVTKAAPPAGLAKHLGRHKVDLSSAQMQMRATIARGLQASAKQLAPMASKSGAPRVFRIPALMLATWYDTAKDSGPTFHKGTDTTAYFKKLLDGFGGNPRGSVTQYYYESSFGQFLVSIDVYGPYTSVHSQGEPCYYGTPDAGTVSVEDPAGGQLGLGGVGAIGMAAEAIPQATDVPWAKYDNDNNGVVDFTMIIHSGGGHEVTGDKCNTHSHQISVSSLANIASGLIGINAETLKTGIPTTTPGESVDRLLTIPEFESTDSPLTIGVAAHEMAHALGEPDYYDTSYASVGTGDYDIMSGGSYLGNPSGSNPAMQNPATRLFQHYLTPKIVHTSLRHVVVRPRTALPSKGYHYGEVDPNLLLIPTYERKVGQTDSLGHVWTADDVYGLAKDPKTGSYVVEGFFVENVSRNATSPILHAGNPMGSMFDRQQHASGLAVWHFDYWRQSTTYFGGANDAQNDPNRYQMDLEEFDQNDNTQELQLNLARGNAADLMTAAATGITSGTKMDPPGTAAATKGTAQAPIELSGTTTPASTGTQKFSVDPKAVNASMEVSIASTTEGDCKLSLTDPKGNTGAVQDSGSFGGAETETLKNPIPGTWTVNVPDFAACGSWAGRVIFTGGAAGSFNTEGAANTWSNWSKKPTGWAFTDIKGYGNGLDMSQEGGGSNNITLDILDLSKKKDVSPGFIEGKLNKAAGTGGLSVGRKSALTVPIFSNGGKAAGKVDVVVHVGSAKGKVVAKKTLTLGSYGRTYLNFTYRPTAEGPVKLVTVVDPRNKIKEGSEQNQVQVTNMWASPAKGKVLIVDDDQVLAHERAIQGALSALGIPYATVAAHPNYSTLKHYKAVVWSSGVDRYEGQFNAGDRKQISRYLNGGGRMLITGNRAMDALTTVGSPQTAANTVDFGAHYFGIRTPTANPSYIVVQPASATLKGLRSLRGLSISTRPSPARQFVGLAGLAARGTGYNGKVIKPFGNSSGIVAPPTTLLGAVTKVADPPFIGVRTNGDKAHHSFRTEIFGWNLGEDNSAATTVKILRRAMLHFGVQVKAPSHPTNRLIYTNPVRDTVSGQRVIVTAVVLGGKGSPTPVLYYRRHARGTFYSVTMTKLAVKGTYSAVIPGNAVTPDGVEYYLKSGPAYAPYGADGKHPLYYSIADAIPEVKNPIKIKH